MLDDFFRYYGLDWGALFFGLMGCYLITKRCSEGFLFSILGCCCGLAVAAISAQYGFITYNVILIGMMFKGYKSWKRDRAAILAAE